MEIYTTARIIHVLAVVVWIGGVAMVTTVILPAVRKMKNPTDQLDTFEQLENRFSLQAKITTLITAITGFFMLYHLDAWERYLEHRFWWIHAMTVVWLLFTLVLFVLEPLLLHRLYRHYGQKNPEKTFRFVQLFHWVLLSLSLITIAGAVAGSHGWLWVN